MSNRRGQEENSSSKEQHVNTDGFEFENEDMDEENVKFQRETKSSKAEETSYGDLEFDDSEGLESYLSDAVAEVTGEKKASFDEEDDDEYEFEPVKKKWSKKKKALVAFGTTVGTLALVVVLVVGWFLFRINYLDESQRVASDLTDTELAAQETLPPRDQDQVLLDEKVINILLIGEEKINSGNGNGRSDSMMIASMNTEDKTLKIVSIMRDSYVSIPGYRNNKLNAAFSFGGGDLLCETIEQNFGIDLDGYVRVDFAGFRKLIDELGGVEIELTEAEAQYLNTTNYISDKSQRNVVPGKQTASGTQALGYCRVRKRAAINGENDDFGRTYRQRAVLTQVYSKVKDLNAVEMVSIVNKLLPYVSTNIVKVDILNYAKAVLQMGIPEIQQKRIPLDGKYYGQRFSNCGSALVIDFDANNQALWEFIYGDGVGDIYTINPSADSDKNIVVTNPPSQTVTRAPATVTKAPVVNNTTKAPVVTQAPAITETKAPVVTEEPEEPKVTKAPVVTAAPEKPKEPKAQVVTPAPVVTEAPVPNDGEGGDEGDDGSVG